MSRESKATSPGIRRSPRFSRTPRSHQTSIGPDAPVILPSNESDVRRLNFDESVQPVRTPRSVDVQAESVFGVIDVSALTDAPDSHVQRCSDITAMPPDSEEQRRNNPSNHVEGHQRTADRAVPNEGQENMLELREDHPGEPGAVLMDDGEGESDAEKVRISAAGEMTQVYGFISHLVVMDIRMILKSWCLRQSGRKKAMVARIMLHLRLAVLSGTTVADTLSAHEVTSRYESWLRMRLSKDETYPVTTNRVPTEEKLLIYLPVVEASEYRSRKRSLERQQTGMDGTEGPSVDDSTPTQPNNERARTNPPDDQQHQTTEGSNGVTENTQFGINEFARLLITIRDDEDARSAVIAMGQELTRPQLDVGVTRGDFWVIVESRFNDPTQRRHLNLAGYVDDVYSSLPPSVHRTATFLKDKFNDAKADFTQYVIRWSASGQNDPDRFRNFLPKLPSGELNALGKRMMVMFVCTRKGTPYEEPHFSNVCCKLIPGGAGRDEGSRIGSCSGEGAATLTQRRKRAQSDSEGVKEIATSLSKIASCYEGRRSVEANDSEKLLKDYSCRLKKIKILGDVVKKLSSHPSEVSSGIDDTGEVSLRMALRKLQRDVSKDLLSGSEDAS